MQSSLPSTLTSLFKYFMLLTIAGCSLSIRPPNPNKRSPASPSTLALVAPLTSPNSVTSPPIAIGGLTSGDSISLFTSSDCSEASKVATGISTGATLQLAPTPLAVGSYQLYAQAKGPEGGVSACSTATVSYQLLTIAHGGWLDIKAVGSTVPHADSGLAPTSAAVTLTWNAPTLSSGSIASYKIFRALAPGAQDYASPVASGISAATRTYTDSTVTNGVTYYYTITPVVSASAVRNTTSVDAEIKIIVPPANMVLVHRWAANQEMCGLMGKTIDRNNQYRCAYTGLGGTGTYYDIQKSFFMDAYEQGCNYTAAPGCSDATRGCLGLGLPAGGYGSVGEVFYSRDRGECFVKTGAATWTNVSGSPALSNAVRAVAFSNNRGLAPVLNVDASWAHTTCQAQSTGGFAGTRKLPSHQQQILSAAWDRSLTDAQITALENGMNHPVTGACNANESDGILANYDNNPKPADMETLPATVSPGRAIMTRTGSIATRNCVSRYGVQDYTGNALEFSSDRVTACSPASHTCQGMISDLDPTNSDLNGFLFNGSMGPGGSAVTGALFSAMSFSATQFLPALGMPIVTSAAPSVDALAIGAGAGQFDPAKFHGNSFALETDLTGVTGGPDRVIIGAGSSRTGSQAGRFLMTAKYPTTWWSDAFGYRCMLMAE